MKSASHIPRRCLFSDERVAYVIEANHCVVILVGGHGMVRQETGVAEKVVAVVVVVVSLLLLMLLLMKTVAVIIIVVMIINVVVVVRSVAVIVFEVFLFVHDIILLQPIRRGTFLNVDAGWLKIFETGVIGHRTGCYQGNGLVKRRKRGGGEGGGGRKGGEKEGGREGGEGREGRREGDRREKRGGGERKKEGKRRKERMLKLSEFLHFKCLS